MEQTQMIEDIKAACRSVADDIESGKLVPGRIHYFRDGAPHCSVGHVAARAGLRGAGDDGDLTPLFDFFTERRLGMCVEAESDAGRFDNVVKLLRKAAE